MAPSLAVSAVPAAVSFAKLEQEGSSAVSLSRRDTFGLAAGLVALGLTAAGADTTNPDAETNLGAAAERAGLIFGTSIAQDTLDNRAQAGLYLDQARIFTADYAMNFGALRPDAEHFTPTEADAILAFAKAGTIPVRGHALAWNESRPDWLMRLSTAEKRKALDRHLDETASYFAGKLHSWNVVNEPFWPGHGLPGFYRAGPWYEAFGKGYVERAFRRTAAVDPGTRLVLNEALTEAWTDTGGKIRTALLQLVDSLQQAGVRLDAVGLEGHLDPARSFDDAGFADFLHQLGERKIDIYITELDVDDTAYDDDIARRDEAVATRYRDFLTAVLAVPAVKILQTWQLADSASWYYHASVEDNPTATRRPRPLPFDEALRRKPAADAMLAAFATRRA